jgi:hypothetical protein
LLGALALMDTLRGLWKEKDDGGDVCGGGKGEEEDVEEWSETTSPRFGCWGGTSSGREKRE